MTGRVHLILGEKQRVSRMGRAGWGSLWGRTIGSETPGPVRRTSGPEIPPRTLLCFPNPQGSLFGQGCGKQVPKGMNSGGETECWELPLSLGKKAEPQVGQRRPS